MKIGLVVLLLAWAVLQAGPAVAGPWRDLLAAQGQEQPDRYQRGLNPRRHAGKPERMERRGSHRQRLSDEERRELHRDLDKARREIYKPRRDR